MRAALFARQTAFDKPRGIPRNGGHVRRADKRSRFVDSCSKEGLGERTAYFRTAAACARSDAQEGTKGVTARQTQPLNPTNSFGTENMPKL